MNTVQINCFMAAAKYGSFSKAASSLYLSQPTFSRNIASLEEELDIRLFTRNSFHGIELTEGGKVMVEAFTSAKKEFRAALEKAHRLEQEAQLHMTFGLLVGQLLDERLEDLLSRFRLSFQNVTIKITRNTYQALMDELHSNEIDIVYMPEWQFAEQAGLTIHFIGEMDTILVVPKRLVLEVGDGVHSIAEFHNYPFIVANDSESRKSRALLRELFSDLKISPSVFETTSLREQIEKVELGEGMLLINPNNSVCYSPNVNCVKIKELVPQPFALAWKKETPNECVTLFQRFLQTECNTYKRNP